MNSFINSENEYRKLSNDKKYCNGSQLCPLIKYRTVEIVLF